MPAVVKIWWVEGASGVTCVYSINFKLKRKIQPFLSEIELYVKSIKKDRQ